MPTSQFLEPYYRYRSLELIRPDWNWARKIWNTLQGYTSFVHQRWVTLLFLGFGYFPYQTKILGGQALDKYLSQGVIFVSIHSGLYPLAGKIFKDFYPQLKLTVPFYFHRRFSMFKWFQKFFQKLDIKVVSLGGAMQYIGPALDQNQSVCLFLDAELPIKHVAMVKLFGQNLPISSGPAYLAKKYHKPIVPVYLEKVGGEIIIHVLAPITDFNQDSNLIMQSVAESLEQMIDQTLSEWQVMDRFLLPNLI